VLRRLWLLPMLGVIGLALAITACGGGGDNNTPTATRPAGTSTLPATATAAASPTPMSTAAVDAGGAAPAGTPPAGGPSNGGGAPPGGASSTPTAGTATYTQSGGSETKTNQTITASESNQSGVKVTDGGTLTLTGSRVNTSGDTTSMDDSSFYGLNAAILAESGSKIVLQDVIVSTSGSGANGVFATGTNSVIELTNVTITATTSGAHGVDATLAGTLVLKDVDITTAGDGASAAIATDRGGGTITVTGGTVKTTGTKSPGIYSTGDITVTGATISATGSEAAAIEGKNSITLTDTTLSGSQQWGVIIYQSLSGDSEVGTGNFTMTSGTLTAETGPLFYVTNTDAVIKLTGVTLNAPSGILLSAKAGDWGTAGSNGGRVTFTADAQSMTGNIEADAISTIDLTLQNGSSLTGAINAGHTAKVMNLTLDGSSTWEVTADSYITCLTDSAGISGTTVTNITGNGHTVYYDSSACPSLGGMTYSLANGGTLTPA
jgi:hypothetical protein